MSNINLWKSLLLGVVYVIEYVIFKKKSLNIFMAYMLFWRYNWPREVSGLE